MFIKFLVRVFCLIATSKYTREVAKEFRSFKLALVHGATPRVVLTHKVKEEEGTSDVHVELTSVID